MVFYVLAIKLIVQKIFIIKLSCVLILRVYLNEVHRGICSSKTQVRSFQLDRYSDTNIPKDLPNTLFNTHTHTHTHTHIQIEKEFLIAKGFGKGEGTRVPTAHEAQGLTSEGTVNVRTTVILKLHDSISYPVVAITRRIVSRVYYANDGGDAVGRLIKRALAAGDKRIENDHIKTAVRNRDKTVMEVLEINRYGCYE
ncbi:hypothetical protein EVAR_48643_1 [Eumeta japonica]|uniref:Uncharacterized protein n=1 Tax=Eumeta variegata TaxID=151549 RepID=A0A4C1XMK8_EUMVA|nr:hypothetical protein EVAR_48643_1 [Eumeta japonica]